MKLPLRNSNSNLESQLSSVVGYGTFITRGYWKDKKNVEVCLVEDYIRIFPKNNWFPYVLPLKNSSFNALIFKVNNQELEALDRYEGVNSGLFKRITTDIILKDHKKIEAFIYIPTNETIISQGLSPVLDKQDLWKKEIEKFPEVVTKFPELI